MRRGVIVVANESMCCTRADDELSATDLRDGCCLRRDNDSCWASWPDMVLELVIASLLCCREARVKIKGRWWEKAVRTGFHG